MKSQGSKATTDAQTVGLFDGQPEHSISLAKRTELLFSLGHTTSRTALVAATITFLLFVPFGISPALWTWFVLVASVTILRLFMFQQFHRNSAAHSIETWLALHSWSAVAAGVSWGLLPLHPTEGLDTAYNALIVVVPTVVAAGAISAYSAFPVHYRALLISMFGTLLLCYGFRRDASLMTATIVLSFIGTLLWGLARRFQRQMYDVMEMRDRLVALNDRLFETNQELAKQQELIDRERELAAHVHLSLTSGSDTDIPNVTVWSKPVSGFSGDLILTVRGPAHRVYLMLGDFTGHGLPAALGAVPATQIFLSMARKGIDIETIAAELHTRLASLLPVGYFCCAALVCVDTLVGDLWAVNAGLPPLLLKRRTDNAVIEFASKYTPLGVGDVPVQPGQAAHTTVADGDSLLLYTDGLIELTNPHDEQWGKDRLLAFVAETRADGSSVAHLQQVCEAFAQETPAADDISVIEFFAEAGIRSRAVVTAKATPPSAA